jgi:hypothetical protein
MVQNESVQPPQPGELVSSGMELVEANIKALSKSELESVKSRLAGIISGIDEQIAQPEVNVTAGETQETDIIGTPTQETKPKDEITRKFPTGYFGKLLSVYRATDFIGSKYNMNMSKEPDNFFGSEERLKAGFVDLHDPPIEHAYFYYPPNATRTDYIETYVGLNEGAVAKTLGVQAQMLRPYASTQTTLLGTVSEQDIRSGYDILEPIKKPMITVFPDVGQEIIDILEQHFTVFVPHGNIRDFLNVSLATMSGDRAIPEMAKPEKFIADYAWLLAKALHHLRLPRDYTAYKLNPSLLIRGQFADGRYDNMMQKLVFFELLSGLFGKKFSWATSPYGHGKYPDVMFIGREYPGSLDRRLNKPTEIHLSVGNQLSAEEESTRRQILEANGKSTWSEALEYFHSVNN